MLHYLSYFLIFLSFFTGFSEATQKTIGITQIVSHPSLDKVYQGIIDTLNAYKDLHSLNIISQNAHGNIVTNSQIAKNLSSIPADIIIAISTPSAQAALNETQKRKIPLVFCAVSDPVAAKLISKLETPDKYATGVMDKQPIDKQLHLIQKYLPQAKTIGFVYNPGEINSVKILETLKENANNYKIIEATASSWANVLPAIQKLVSKVDLIYVPTDNVVVSALDSILKVAWTHHIPVVSCDPDLVEKGVLFSEGASYYEMGQSAALLAIQILEGTPIETMPVLNTLRYNTYINQDSAKKLGISLNQSP